jgi:hypothetical protein
LVINPLFPPSVGATLAVALIFGNRKGCPDDLPFQGKTEILAGRFVTRFCLFQGIKTSGKFNITLKTNALYVKYDASGHG